MAVDSFSAVLEDRSVTVLLGPSGCGKTSLLRILAGLSEADSGQATAIPPGQLSYAFQEPRLLPWASCLGNIRLVLDDLLPREAARERAQRYLDLVDLSSFGRKRPSKLSGGMRQRLSLARAFARPSSVLLMDEPFQSLDIASRVALMDVVQRLWEAEPRTVLMVTHDIQEALYLADRIIVLSPRPSVILESLSLPAPRGRRDLSSAPFQTLEARLYRLLTGLAGEAEGGGPGA